MVTDFENHSSEQRGAAVDRLAAILVDMVRSALMWEQNHSEPALCGDEGLLTGMSCGVYTGNAQSQNGGEWHDDDKDCEEDEAQDYLRRPEGA